MDILIFSRIELFNVTGEVRANKKGYARKKERKKEGRKERKKERKKEKVLGDEMRNTMEML